MVTAYSTLAPSSAARRLVDILRMHHGDLLRDWIDAQTARRAMPAAELRAQCSEFLTLLIPALAAGGDGSIDSPEWAPVKEFLSNLSVSRAQQGFSPSETATFVFSLKESVFRRIRDDGGADAATVAGDMWAATLMFDSLGLFTTEVYQRGREQIIAQQQQDMLELSTPVVTLWDGVVALPLIGTLDSARTQIVMETLLKRIVETGAAIAVIDITGVPTVDTLTAQHLLKTVTAARLMGAECIISGIRPQIAQTIVHLGVDLGDITTKATLADAFRVALARSGRTVVRASVAAASSAEGGRSSNHARI
jgi:rsbT co-antagonist protein RsbR